ncbi:MAG: hypothetical protein LQ348_005149 [Seirophora lacunosa]|nr:MAG: hypothetical protein LQ348_005149 [Seirophora lacunosa]
MLPSSCIHSILTLSLIGHATALWKGFNLPANNPSGSCKSQEDWAHDFSVMQSLPGRFSSARVYASSDCNTLAAAVPAAIASGTTLLLGVWTEDNAHYEAEKAALVQAIQQHGTSWIIAVSVGSEDLYRGDTDAATLARQINEVRGLLCKLGACGIEVGHVDTWTAWVDPKNEDVIRACDFVGYPYFEGSNIEQGYNDYEKNLKKTRDTVNRVKPGVWVWVTETGWPVSGGMLGSAVASVSNAEAYWKGVACEAFSNAHTFWYTLQDYLSSPSFGVVDANFKPLVNEVIDEAPAHHAPAAEDQRPSSSSKPNAVDLMREEEKFSKHKVEQLAIVKEANLLVSLSNGVVSIHDLQTYQLQETLVKTKGATAFAVTSNIVKDSPTDVPLIVSRLAVAVKRRVILWSWHDSELHPDTSELVLVTGVKTLTWATGTKLIAGLTSTYVLVDVETSVVTDIIGPGSIGGAPGQDGGRFGGVGVSTISYMGLGGVAPKPLATHLGEGEMLLAKDINTLFIDTDGQSLGRRQIPWAVAPEAIGYSYPYLLALQATRGTLEVRNPETLTLLQTISLPSASQLHISQPYISLAHAGKGFLVLSDRCIWRMGALGYDSQINALVDRFRLDEAISLLGMLEDALLMDKEGRLREIKMLKAQTLFDLRRYREALDLFTEVSAPPQRVIQLFPPIIAGPTSSLSKASDNTKDADEYAKELKAAQGEPENSELDEKVSKDFGSIRRSTDGSRAASDDAATTSVAGSQPSDSKPMLEGKDLKAATAELRPFLVSARTRLQRYLNPDGTLRDGQARSNTAASNVQEAQELLLAHVPDSHEERRQQMVETAHLVDTTLFRAYMFASPSLAGPLFRLDNFCDPDVVKEKLIETGRYNDLVDFFYGKGLHQQALELLERFGKQEQRDETASQLAGPQRTVAYLQNLPPEMIDLILRFVSWPLDESPELGMEVFLADSERAETLPRQRVLDFLEKKDRALAVRYLKHIIQELDDRTASFHQRLAEDYIEGLRQQGASGRPAPPGWEEDALNFLRSSYNYQPFKALQMLTADDPNLYEARAIVLSKMGQHRQALDIYVFKMRNPGKAEDYCNQVQLAEISTATAPRQGQRSLATDLEHKTTSIYHTLLSLYLSPPPPHKPQWGPALSILAKHGARMPASSTLDLIPEVLPIKDLESYFRGRIRSANTIVNESRLISSLRSSVAFSEEAKLRLGDGIPSGNGGRNRHVLITEDRVCGVCYKRFGGSAIKVLPK